MTLVLADEETEERRLQIDWTIDHQRDIESDLSAFHRVDDPLALPARRYFLLASRLLAYKGILQARYLAAEHERIAAEGHRSASHGRTGASPEYVDNALFFADLAGAGEDFEIERG